MSDSPVSSTSASNGSVSPINVVPSVLTAEQEKAVTLLYDDAKEIIKTIMDAPTTNIVVTVSKIIGEVITLVEAISATKTSLSGADKKVVVIDVIQKILNDVISDETLKEKIIAIFNEIVDSTIDIMISVSHSLQAVKKVEVEIVDKVESTCCSFVSKN